MPVWVIIVIVVGIVAALAGIAAGAFFGWRYTERRYLLRLVGRLEAIEAVRAALTEACARLADASSADIAAFAQDPDSADRHALSSVATHATILVEELDTMPVPPGLRQAAESLADAAFTVARESGRVREEQTGEEVLEVLATIDLQSTAAYVGRAREAVLARCEACGLDDQSLYGGGLYL